MESKEEKKKKKKKRTEEKEKVVALDRDKIFLPPSSSLFPSLQTAPFPFHIFFTNGTLEIHNCMQPPGEALVGRRIVATSPKRRVS